jgi:hypothetical protein
MSPTEYPYFEPIRHWLGHLPIHGLMVDHTWSWPIAESIHFFGLAMMIGSIGLFDLRLMGLAKQMSPASVHRLIPWGLAGFALCVVTGFGFLCGAPDQYLYNEAFWWKVAFLVTAGANAGVFYLATFEGVRNLPAGADAPLAARLAGWISLACWIGVMAAGRLLTFFRPAYV